MLCNKRGTARPKRYLLVPVRRKISAEGKELSLGSRSAVLPGSARRPWRQSRGGGAACRRGRRQKSPPAPRAVHGEVIANDALHFN
ncbi:hypothetical protein EVAR_100837_1 [Eumeta japonica]|uniref:Uncharacterized protein n=1 Tax=Eumeta variegata TaxID=151549 RepID=A0A4C1T1Q4_EUMVA|nr:hypothetical protein EVAR_100837_1 [Eumeta japonica]